METLVTLFALIVAVAVGFGIAVKVWRPRTRRALAERDATQDALAIAEASFVLDETLPAFQRQFRVILSTDRGADARKLFERVTPRGEALVEFYENNARRDIKGTVDG